MEIGEENRHPLPADGLGNEPSRIGAANGAGQVTCPDCGAFLPLDTPRCPYCGALNPYGAEKEYMGELDDIKDATGGLVDKAKGRMRANLLGNVKRTVAIVAGVVLVFAAMMLASAYMDRNNEQQELRDFQAREAFRADHFGEFDRLYEAGDYDALSDYVWSLVDEPGFDALYSWRHAGFLEAHDDWEALRIGAEEAQEGEFTIDDYTWLVSTALRLAQLDGDDSSLYESLSPEEEQQASEYRAYAHRFLWDTLQMDDEEVATFAEAAKDDLGYIQRDRLRESLGERLRQIGTL